MIKKLTRANAMFLAGLAMVASVSCKQGTPAASRGEEKPAGQAAQAAFLGNAVCPIMGNPAQPTLFVEYNDPATRTHAKIYMCCPGCKEAIEKDPAAAYKKVYLERELKGKDGKLLAAKGEPRELKNSVCPIETQKVVADSWVVYNGCKVALCCQDCEPNFMKSPDKYLAELVKTP